MPELKASPRNRALGLLADALSGAKSAADTVQLPVVGGLGSLLFGDAPELVNDVAYYGPQALVRGGNAATGGLGTFAPDRRVLDAIGVAPMAPGAVRAAKTVANPMTYGRAFMEAQTPAVMSNVLPPKKYQGKLLEGLPPEVDMGGGRMEAFGTDQRIVDIAKQYMADKGLRYVPQDVYAVLDKGRGKRIAEAYEAAKDAPSDPKVRKAYQALADETAAQYEALRKAGYKFDFMDNDIYGNPRNAINDLILNKRMSVFPTEQGFGTVVQAADEHPLLKRTGETWNGKPVTYNDLFRAVHDAFGHAKHGVGFRARGEENAYQAHARMYSPDALPAAASELRGQNSTVNFGKYGEFNQTASPADTVYADQKTVILPDWAIYEGLLGIPK